MIHDAKFMYHASVFIMEETWKEKSFNQRV